MKIAIAGLGLIGGSLGMALKKADKGLEIIGIDINQDIIEKGVSLKSIDWGTCSIQEGVKDADVVFIAVSLSQTVSMAEEILPFLKPGAIISDTGSTKKQISDNISSIVKRRKDISYVGGHPMAGSEKSGIDAADPYLFENAVYVILNDNSDLSAKNKIIEIVEKTGARILLLDSDEHDIMVASVSHLPHLLAGALVNTVGEIEKKHENVFKIAAGGFRDVTRIADSQPELWRDIFLSNKESLLDVLKIYKDQIDELEIYIRSDKSNDLKEKLARSKKLREQVPKKVKGLLPTLSEIVVTIPDKPGEIGKVANILGAKDINIIDIEILRVREGDGGTLRLGFIHENEREKAIEVLKFFGYGTKII